MEFIVSVPEHDEVAKLRVVHMVKRYGAYRLAEIYHQGQFLLWGSPSMMIALKSTGATIIEIPMPVQRPAPMVHQPPFNTHILC